MQQTEQQTQWHMEIVILITSVIIEIHSVCSYCTSIIIQIHSV